MNSEKDTSLDALIALEGNQSLTRKLSAIHDDIEKAIASGISHERIVKELEAQGYGAVKLNAFRSALKRIRAKKKKQIAPAKNSPQAAPATSSLPSYVSNHASNPSENTQAFAPLLRKEGSTIASNLTKDLKGLSWNQLKKLPFNF